MTTCLLTSPRFEISINGEHRCIAGFDGYAVLSFGITHLRRTGIAHIHVGGLQGREHVSWLQDDLFVGDEVTIRVREGGPIDPSGPRELSPDAIRRQIEQRQKRLADDDPPPVHRFSVTVNGDNLCTAGVESGVLTVLANWVRRDPAECPPHEKERIESWQGPTCDLSVGGMENKRHFRWCEGELELGDEVIVRVLGPGSSDPPEHRFEHREIPHREHAIMLEERVSIRKLIEDDVDFLAEMLGDPEVNRYCPKRLDRAGAEEWLGRQQQRYAEDGCGYWLVVDSETHDRVGVAGVLMTDVEGERLPCLGYMIHRPFQRQGYGVRAAWMCITWRDPEEQPPIYTLVQPENAPALALARKLGMKPVRTVTHEGIEHLLFALRRPEL